MMRGRTPGDELDVEGAALDKADTVDVATAEAAVEGAGDDDDDGNWAALVDSRAIKASTNTNNDSRMVKEEETGR
jgi:hypothetical protein